MSVKINNFLSKRWLLNYLLLTFILLLIWLGLPNSESTKKIELLRSQPQDIEQIKIKTQLSHLEFSKQSVWFMTNPVYWPASAINLKRLSSVVNLEPYKSVDVSKVDLKTLGFIDSSSSLQVNEDVIMFGDINPIGQKRYVRVNDSIHLVEDNHLAIVSSGITGLIDKTLIPKSIELKELKLPLLTLTRDDSKSWQLNPQPENYSVDQTNQLIANWQTLESVRIEPYDTDMIPLKTISAKTSLGDITFTLLSLEPEIILAREDLGVQFHYDDSFYNDLFSLDKQKLALKRD